MVTNYKQIRVGDQAILIDKKRIIRYAEIKSINSFEGEKDAVDVQFAIVQITKLEKHDTPNTYVIKGMDLTLQKQK